MPWRRQLGNVAETYLKFYLNNKNNASENERVSLRQQELARLNHDASAEAADQAQKLEVLKQILGDPTGRIADVFRASGVHTQGDINLDAIPGVIDSTAARARTNHHADVVDTGAANLEVDQNRLPFDTKKAGDIAGATAYGSGIGTNKAENETNPDKITRENDFQVGTRRQRGLSAGFMSNQQAVGAQAASAPEKDVLEDGTVVWRKYNPATKQMEDVPGPPTQGAHPGKVRNLLATEVAQLSDINTAEVEGVKLLAYLKQNGLDKSNDPLDPRWNNFLATKLKMAGNPDAGDAQQRAAFVNAVALRGLMQGRPSKYMAELFGQHLPNGKMSGQKLYQVLNDVLTQGSERRLELSNLTGTDVKEPVSGQTFSQWQKLAAEQEPKPAVQLPGQPPPAVNMQGLDPAIQQILAR